MAIQSMPTGTGGSDASGVGPALEAARGQYRVTVLGTDAADVVRNAGGWLFDRAMAGWVVDVWLADSSDARPLHILGATAHALESRTSEPAADGTIAGLAVAGALVAADRAVGAEVAGALRTGHTEVVLWGAPWPDLLGGRSGSVRHTLSAAARTFKRQALIAAGCGDCAVGRTEAMTGGGYRPVDSDLAALGG